MDTARKFRIQDKTCCTCEYWTGQRKPDINQNFVTAMPKDKGICFGIRKPIEKSAQDKMPCCLPWLVLQRGKKSEALQDLQNVIENIKNNEP